MVRALPCLDPGQRRDALESAVRAARNGRLVALPAESGYVLATDAFSAAGVAALQAAKGLSAGTTLGVLVGHAAGVHGIAAGLPSCALDLIAAFWPGQLSLVVAVQPSLRWTVPTDRCVVRMPLHPVLLDVAAAVGPMVYSGIATPAQRESASVLLDCGDRPEGPGSTVIDVCGPAPVLLRPGAVPVERLRQVVADLVVPQ